MNRETPAVLKRMLISALAAFGISAVAFGQDVPQIPAPEGVPDIRACVDANTVPKALKAQELDATGAGTDPGLEQLTGVKEKIAGDCEYAPDGTSKSIDLRDLVSSLSTKLRRLDPDDDDYQEELKALREDFPGTVFDKVVDEFEARDKTDDVRDDYIEERDAFNDDDGAGTEYKAIAVGTAGVDATLTATSNAAAKTAYKGTVGFDVKRTEVEDDDEDTEFQDETERYVADEDIDLRYTRTTAGVMVQVDAKGNVTELEIAAAADDRTETDVSIDLSGEAPTSDVTDVTTAGLGFIVRNDDDDDGDLTNDTLDLNDLQQLGYLKGHLTTVQKAREDLNTVLEAAEAGTLKVGEGEEAEARRLSLGDRNYLKEVLANYDDEIDAFEDLIEDIEAYVDPLTGDSAFDDEVENYKEGKSELERLLGDLQDARIAQREAARNVVKAIRDPGDHLDTLVDVANKKLADAREDLEGDALDPYVKLQEAVTEARGDYLVPGEGDPAKELLDALIAQKDTGGALITAVSANHDAIQEVAKRIPESLDIDVSGITKNADDIDTLGGRVADNEDDIADINSAIGITSDQHGGPDGCGNRIDCNEARSMHNEDDIEALGGRVDAHDTMLANHEMRITANADDIDKLQMEDVRLEARIDDNWDAIEVNQMDIDANEAAIAVNRTDIDANEAAIMAEETARMAADTMHDTMIAENKMTGMTNATNIGMNKGMIMTNAEAISGLDGRVGANATGIMRNSDMIGELSESLDVVRAGVAASMALAGMPAVNGRGIAIGVGSFDGESAFAVGFQIAGEQASFKVGVTSSGGATGASAGVGFNF